MEQLRRVVFERDGFRCQHLLPAHILDEDGAKVAEFWEPCLASVTWENGHLAHITSRGAGGHDTPENCLTKCADCHAIREHRYGKSGIKPVPKK